MDGVAGYTTYLLKLDLDPATQGNCYTIYGDSVHGAMTFPPAYQVKQRCQPRRSHFPTGRSLSRRTSVESGAACRKNNVIPHAPAI